MPLSFRLPAGWGSQPSATWALAGDVTSWNASPHSAPPSDRRAIGGRCAQTPTGVSSRVPPPLGPTGPSSTLRTPFFASSHMPAARQRAAVPPACLFLLLRVPSRADRRACAASPVRGDDDAGCRACHHRNPATTSSVAATCHRPEAREGEGGRAVPPRHAGAERNVTAIKPVSGAGRGGL